MSGRPHEIITTPDTGASWFSKGGSIRRRFDRRLLICETHVLLPFVHERYPLVPFFPGDEHAEEKPYELCAMPTISGLQQMLRAAGYNDIELVYTPSFQYWKKLVSLVTNRPQSGRGLVHAHVESN